MDDHTEDADGLRKFVVRRLGRVQRHIGIVSRFGELEDVVGKKVFSDEASLIVRTMAFLPSCINDLVAIVGSILGIDPDEITKAEQDLLAEEAASDLTDSERTRE